MIDFDKLLNIQNKNIDTALDYLFDEIDEMMLDGKFEEIDYFLETATILCKHLADEIKIGIWTITHAGKDKLEKRESFGGIKVYYDEQFLELNKI